MGPRSLFSVCELPVRSSTVSAESGTQQQADKEYNKNNGSAIKSIIFIRVRGECAAVQGQIRGSTCPTSARTQRV